MSSNRILQMTQTEEFLDYWRSAVSDHLDSSYPTAVLIALNIENSRPTFQNLNNLNTCKPIELTNIFTFINI